MATHREGSQRFPINLPCGHCSTNISCIEPELGALLNIHSWHPGTTCSLLLYSLTALHFNLEVLMDLLHRCLNLISIDSLWVSFVYWFSYAYHPGMHTVYRKKQSTFLSLRCSILRSKLCQWNSLDRTILLMIIIHQNVLYHTSILSFHLTICLWVQSC